MDAELMNPNSKIPIREGREALRFLSQANLEKTPYYEIKFHTDNLIRCGYAGGMFTPGEHLIWRGVKIPAEKILTDGTKVSRLSYRPKDTNSNGRINFNRASTDKYQIFYGAIPTPEFKDSHVIAIAEICDVMKPTFPVDVFELITMGRWLIRKPFFVASVGMHSNMAKSSSWAKMMADFANQSFKSHPHGQFLAEVSAFLGIQFSRKVPEDQSYLYKISAAYGDSLFDHGVGGVMFPSVKSDGKAFNVALRSECIDQDFVEIDIAVVMKLAKVGGEFIHGGGHLQCEHIIDGMIVWEDVPDESKVELVDVEKYRQQLKRNGLL